jgi:hypothetical protein
MPRLQFHQIMRRGFFPAGGGGANRTCLGLRWQAKRDTAFTQERGRSPRPQRVAKPSGFEISDASLCFPRCERGPSLSDLVLNEKRCEKSKTV